MAEFKNRIFIAFPTVPADISSGGVAEFRALHDKYKFAPRHTPAQLSAFAAAKVFVEALTRAGKDLSREKLATTLEGLYEYETGTTPHYGKTFSLPQRHKSRAKRGSRAACLTASRTPPYCKWQFFGRNCLPPLFSTSFFNSFA